jgi:hypothetical protein
MFHNPLRDVGCVFLFDSGFQTPLSLFLDCLVSHCDTHPFSHNYSFYFLLYIVLLSQVYDLSFIALFVISWFICDLVSNTSDLFFKFQKTSSEFSNTPSALYSKIAVTHAFNALTPDYSLVVVIIIGINCFFPVYFFPAPFQIRPLPP